MKDMKQLRGGCCKHQPLVTLKAKSTRTRTCAEGEKGLFAPPFPCTAWFEGQHVASAGRTRQVLAKEQKGLEGTFGAQHIHGYSSIMELKSALMSISLTSKC